MFRGKYFPELKEVATRLCNTVTPMQHISPRSSFKLRSIRKSSFCTLHAVEIRQVTFVFEVQVLVLFPTCSRCYLLPQNLCWNSLLCSLNNLSCDPYTYYRTSFSLVSMNIVWLVVDAGVGRSFWPTLWLWDLGANSGAVRYPSAQGPSSWCLAAESLALDLLRPAPTMIVIPDELFILIFSQMPYSSLLQSTTVCRSWRLIILGNIFLCKQIFKIPTEAEETESCGLPSASHIQVSHDILYKVSGLLLLMGFFNLDQFHPAISRVTYCIGDTLDDVHLASYNASIRLVDLEVSNDFACIPSVTEIQGSISPTPHKRNSLPWTWSIAFTATNPDGVRVMDIFSSMVLACVYHWPGRSSRGSCDFIADPQRNMTCCQFYLMDLFPNAYICIKLLLFLRRQRSWASRSRY